MRRDLYDVEAQVADSNRTDRDERHNAARYDRREYRRVNGVSYDVNDLPHPSDVWEAGDEL